MPLIDVVFLLLTFFIYALVLMVRAELLPMPLPEIGAATPADVAPAATISIDEAGNVYLDREAVPATDLIAALEARLADAPGLVVYLAAAETGDTDRLPVFLDLYDRLAAAGIEVRLVGRPKD